MSNVKLFFVILLAMLVYEGLRAGIDIAWNMFGGQQQQQPS